MNRKLQILGCVLISLVMVSFVGHLVIELIEGRGGDIYKSYKGLSFSPIGVLIFVVSIPFFIGIAKLNYWYSGKEERDFKQYLRSKRANKNH